MLRRYLRLRGIPDEGACMCLIGWTGSRRLVAAGRHDVRSLIRRYHGVSTGKAIGKAWQQSRFRAPYLRNSLWDLGYATDTLETAVTWDKVSATVNAVEEAIRTALSGFNERVHVMSHLSRLYPTGTSVYTTYLFRLADTAEETFARWHAQKEAASRAIVACGGTISHQHGVGIDHRHHLEAEKGPLGISILRAVCAEVDPDGHMNPGKLLPNRPSLPRTNG
jgi:alkyldihydroxyacetonephosphate synthase